MSNLALLRPVYRLPALLGHVATGIGLAYVIRIAGPERIPPSKVASWWSRRLLRIFNVRVRYHGEPISNPAHTKVANHISWLDMFVLATHGDHRFVAKSELANWPVASTLAEAMDVIYIRRGRGGARPVVEKTRKLLNGGEHVLFFPEGTTTDGNQVLHFYPRLFEAAQATQTPVQAVAIQYRTETQHRHIAPFIGDDTLVNHIWQLLKHPGFRAELHYSAPLEPSVEASQLAHEAATFVATKLGVPVMPAQLRAA